MNTKRARSGHTGASESARYDPWYWGRGDISAQQLMDMLRMSAAIAKKQKQHFTVSSTQPGDELASYQPMDAAEAADKLQQAIALTDKDPKTTGTPFLDENPAYPHFYSLEYHRKRRLLGLLKGKIEEPTNVSQHPLFGALAQLPPREKGAALLKLLAKQAADDEDDQYTEQANKHMTESKRRKYFLFGPKVTKKHYGVDMMGQKMTPKYFRPDYKPGFMIRTKPSGDPDPLHRYTRESDKSDKAAAARLGVLLKRAAASLGAPATAAVGIDWNKVAPIPGAPAPKATRPALQPTLSPTKPVKAGSFTALTRGMIDSPVYQAHGAPHTATASRANKGLRYSGKWPFVKERGDYVKTDNKTTSPARGVPAQPQSSNRSAP